jgi:hypothetical protein
VRCLSSRRLLGVLLGCIIPCLGRTASAQGERPRAEASAEASRVRLLVLESFPEFGARVRGQLSDLDVLLEIDGAVPNAPRAELDARLAELAARRGADVVAWLGAAPADAGSSQSDSIAVHIWIAGRGPVYSRRIGPAALPRAAARRADENHSSVLETRPTLDLGDEQSATLETAALFVRGAVRSVLFERAGARAELASEAAPAIEPPPAVSSAAMPEPAGSAASASPGGSPDAVLQDTDRDPAGASSALSTPLAWATHAGLDWTYAGLSRSGSWSIDAGFGLRLGRWNVGVDGSVAFPEIVHHENVELSLRRQTLLAEIGWEVLRLPSFALRPTVQAGAARFSRSSSSSAASRAPTAERFSWSPLVALRLGAEYEITRALRLSSSAGLGWVSQVPRYVLEVLPARRIAPLEAWHWQPNVGIALGAVF